MLFRKNVEPKKSEVDNFTATGSPEKYSFSSNSSTSLSVDQTGFMTVSQGNLKVAVNTQQVDRNSLLASSKILYFPAILAQVCSIFSQCRSNITSRN